MVTNSGPARRTTEVLVLGLGPSGRALLSRLVARGVDALGVDPAPERPWTATYALWSYEVPAWLPPTVVAGTDAVRAFARSAHTIADPYVVLDPASVARGADGQRGPAGRRSGRPGGRAHGPADRRSGAVRGVGGGRPRQPIDPGQGPADGGGRGAPPQQYWRDLRLLVHGLAARQRRSGGRTRPRSCTWCPVADDRVLVEETCLVGRPPLGYRELRTRLQTRLRNRGVRLRGDEPEEHVRFAVEAEPADPARDAGQRGGPPRWPSAPAGGIIQPATGYSVAPSLRLADNLAVLLAAGAPADAADLLVNRRRQLVRLLRTAGLTTLLRLPPDGVAGLLRGVLPAPPGPAAGLPDRARPAGRGGWGDGPDGPQPRPPADRGGGRLHAQVAAPPAGPIRATRPSASRTTAYGRLVAVVMIYAHRGYSAKEPEMTRAAYRQAIAWAERTGSSLGLETDVHFSADGQLICLHDLSVDRTSTSTGRAYERTLAELQTLDFGSRKVRRPTDEQRTLIGLAELLELTADARERGCRHQPGHRDQASQPAEHRGRGRGRRAARAVWLDRARVAGADHLVLPARSRAGRRGASAPTAHPADREGGSGSGGTGTSPRASVRSGPTTWCCGTTRTSSPGPSPAGTRCTSGP